MEIEGQSTASEEDDQDLEILNEQTSEEVLEPKVGMMFDSEDAARTVFIRYGKAKGFGVVSLSSKNNKWGVRNYSSFGCHKGREKKQKGDPLKPEPTAKIDCPVIFRISKQDDDKWKLTKLVLEHNHDLNVELAKYLKCNRNIQPHKQRAFELNCGAGINMYRTLNAMGRQAGGRQNLTWTERDARNYMNQVRSHQLKEGDAQAMLKYFAQMQEDNSNFFYLMDLDDDSRLQNVFWADARSREAYKEFGDVVTFDTTYLVNRFDMPFAPFVGINHHGQSILFGCGLVTSEDTESFVWLFKAWLSCMSNCPPKAIITDQCRAMQNAIKQVFPSTTRHRWCFWHIMKKIPEKFKTHPMYKSIMYGLKVAVHDSLSIEEFENSWAKCIERHKLEANEWLQNMFDERERWVPAFLKDTFWAGMSTTQHSESMNAFFDGYVRATTTLAEFVLQYEEALRKKVQKEEEEDSRCLDKQYCIGTPFAFEKQFREAYTVTKFYEFREEVKGLLGCEYVVSPVVDGVAHFFIEHTKMVGKKNPFCKTFNFVVRYNEENGDINCNCRLFESRGMVCTHIILVWKYKKLSEVPEKYILHRWRTGIVRRHTKVRVSYTNWQCKPEWRRLDNLTEKFGVAADGVIFSEARSQWFDGILDDVIASNKLYNENLVNKYNARNSIVVRNSAQKGSTSMVVGDPSKGPRRVRVSEKRRQTIFEQEARKKTKSSQKSKSNKENVCPSQDVADVHGSQRSVTNSTTLFDLDLNAPLIGCED